jgi:hypothetical protein
MLKYERAGAILVSPTIQQNTLFLWYKAGTIVLESF